MKYLIILIGSLIISGCTITVKPETEVEQALKQHAILLDKIVGYIEDCQAQGVCPKPEEKK